MRALHVVSLSEDGRYVLLAPNKNATTGTFRVALDDRLAAAVRGDLPRPGESARPASSLTPKEIQARLRAGETVEQIAAAAGVPAARVERFAGPVEGERARTIEAARGAVLHRSRRGASAVALGQAVDAHLAEIAGLDDGSVVWSARRRDDGSWLVEVTFSARGRKKRGGWVYDPHTREVAAVDASSSVLGFLAPDDDAGPGKVVAAPAATPRRRTPSSRARSSAPTSRRSAAAPRVPTAARQAPATKAAAKRTAPARTAAGGAPPAAARTATTRPVAAAKASAGKASAGKASAGKAAAGKASPGKASPGKVPAGRVPAGKAPAGKAPAGKVPAGKAPARTAPAAKGSKTVATSPATRSRSASSSARTAVAPAAARTSRPASAAAPRPAASTTKASRAARSAAPAATSGATARPARPAAARPAAGPPPSPQPQSPPQLRVVPDPDAPSKRASVPAWEDVLLSTRPRVADSDQS